MYSNFNVTELNAIRTKSDDIFSAILSDIKAIQDECSKMGEIVLSDDSNLGARWNSVSDNIGKPIETINDTFVIVKALLNSYVENTIENEKIAQAELEQIDNNITTLSNRASVLLDGLSTLKGIGIGTEALAIAGVSNWAEGEEPISYKGESYTGGTASEQPFIIQERANGPKVVKRGVQELAEATAKVQSEPIEAKMDIISAPVNRTALKDAISEYNKEPLQYVGSMTTSEVSKAINDPASAPDMAQFEYVTNSGPDPYISLEGIAPLEATGELHEENPDVQPFTRID